MKKFLLISFTLIAGFGLSIAQNTAKKSESANVNVNGPKAVFNKTTHDFGKIKESDEKATTVFTVKNEGTTPLIIQNATASCGCTTPEFTRTPIKPGETGTISVAYSTIGRPGVFNKNVTLFTNVPDEVYTLVIKGEVIRDK